LRGRKGEEEGVGNGEWQGKMSGKKGKEVKASIGWEGNEAEDEEKELEHKVKREKGRGRRQDRGRLSHHHTVS
jgi:hypothetical protein